MGIQAERIRQLQSRKAWPQLVGNQKCAIVRCIDMEPGAVPLG